MPHTIKQKILLTTICILGLLSTPTTFAQANNNLDIPQIISRSQWGADEKKMYWPVEYAKTQKFIIHHTASSNLIEDSDSSGEYKDMVNNIYAYHTNNKAWKDENGEKISGFGDIGYNYLVDPNGNLYEGRDGGNGAIGGHASGFNTGTIGISVIGNHHNTEDKPSHNLNSKITTSLSKLIGWLAANNDINLSKVSSFNNKNIDGVVGHRDVGATLCPGNVLYSQLDTIQNQAQQYAQTYQNFAYQLPNSTAIYVIKDGFRTKFDNIDMLPTAYKNYTIKSITPLQLNAYHYKDLVLYPHGSLLQERNKDIVYYIDNEQKRPLELNEKEFLALGFDKNNIISVAKRDLSIYEDGLKVKLGPEKKLIKDSKNSVFLVEQGRKRLFTSAQLFDKLGYKWNKVSSDSNADYYLEGEMMKYPNGTTVKIANHPNIYLITADGRRTFSSASLFETLGYKWKNILTIDSAELYRYSLIGNVIYPDNTLIKTINNPTIYLVKDGQKKELTSPTLLHKLGLKFSQVITIPDNQMDDYFTGDIMRYPNGTVIKTANNPVLYQVTDNYKKEFSSAELLKTLKISSKSIVTISPEEMQLYPTNGYVSYPENSLLRAQGGDKVYVIKNGKAEWIKTLEEFNKAGYKWNQVTDITTAELNLYLTNELPNQKPIENTPSIPSTPNKPNTPNQDTKPNTPPAINPPQSSSEPNIRVAITSSTQEDIIITANGDYTVQYYDEKHQLYKTVQKKSTEKTVVPFFDWGKYIKFTPNNSDTVLQILSYSDPSWDLAVDDNRFRGILEIKYSPVSKKLWVINDLKIEDYLNGIAEATTYTEEEYLKAFSIITRTYAMYYINNGGKHKGEDFHLKNSRNNNGNDQIYRGYDLEVRAHNITTANKNTAGQIITFNNQPIVAAYSSDSGGVTKDACKVLSKNYCSENFAYLRGGVSDPPNTPHDSAKISASHGAGMSAVGAAQMAKEGSDWKKIITYYYPEVQVEKKY